MQLYAITDRSLLGSGEPERIERLAALAGAWAAGDVEWIQIREKDLNGDALLDLTSRMIAAVRAARTGSSVKAVGTIGQASISRILVNGSPEVACAAASRAGADGVHLPGGWNAESIAQVRREWGGAGRPMISVACHSAEDAARAAHCSVDVAVVAPVFGKRLESGATLPGTGLGDLRKTCVAAGGLPIFALGGVTAWNAAFCEAAGAAGVAGIRMFADGSWTLLRETAAC